MIEVSRHTALPPEALWPVLSDVRRWPQWLPTVDAVHPAQPDRPEEVGASYVLEQPRLPRATWTISQWDPGASFVWESRSPGVVSTGRHVLAPDSDGTTITLSIDWTGPLSPLVRLLLGGRTRDYVTTEAEALERTAAEHSGR